MTDHNARQAGITEALHYLQMGIANLELGNGVHMIDFRNAERAILAAHSADASNAATGQGLTEALHYLQMGIANLELGNGVHMVDFRNAERALLEKDRG